MTKDKKVLKIYKKYLKILPKIEKRQKQLREEIFYNEQVLVMCRFASAILKGKEGTK